MPALARKTGLKITSIESFVQGTSPGIVRVRTEEGAEGCGQLSPYDADITAAILQLNKAKSEVRRLSRNDPGTAYVGGLKSQTS